MWQKSVSAVSVLAIVLAAVFLFSGQASAGQFKRLNAAAGLGVGGQVTAASSPQNQGAAMEMDTYEFLTAPAGATYRLRIVTNTTGQVLNVRFIGVNGTIITQCSTPAGGLCDTPAVGLGGNLLFIGLVATQNGSPVPAGSTYTFAVQRTA